jgi:hypothetical protein
MSEEVVFSASFMPHCATHSLFSPAATRRSLVLVTVGFDAPDQVSERVM